MNGVAMLTVNAQDAATAPVSVTEDNDAPVFPQIAPVTVNADNHETVNLTLNAFDSDLPAQTLTYIALNLPEGATLNPVTGEFSWTPTSAYGGQNYFVKFKVADNGEPQRAAAQAVLIKVETANLLKNPGFQLAGTNTRQAENWKGFRLLPSDKRVCKPIAENESGCEFQFSATPAKAANRKLRQPISTDALVSGDTVTFGGTFRAKALTNGARVQLVANFADGETQRATVKLTTGGNTNPSIVHSFGQSLTLTAAPVEMWLEISTGKSSGKLWLDDLVVMETTPTLNMAMETANTPNLIPVPAAPDLRGGAAIGMGQ